MPKLRKKAIRYVRTDGPTLIIEKLRFKKNCKSGHKNIKKIQTIKIQGKIWSIKIGQKKNIISTLTLEPGLDPVLRRAEILCIVLYYKWLWGDLR